MYNVGFDFLDIFTHPNSCIFEPFRVFFRRRGDRQNDIDLFLMDLIKSLSVLSGLSLGQDAIRCGFRSLL